MASVTVTIAAWAIYAGGGLCAGLLTYMRICNRMANGRVKRVVGRTALFGLTALGAVGGVLAGWSPWVGVPTVVLLIYAGLETVCLVRRRRFRAEGPAETRCIRPARWITTSALRVVRYEVAAPWACAPLLRIGHASDLHINEESDPEYLHAIAETIQEARPDVLLLAGDFVHEEAGCPRLSAFLSAMSAPHGVFASLGNHDYAVGADAVRRQLRACGVQVLDRAAFTVDAGGGRRFLLCGDDRPWGDTRPADELPKAVPVIGLSHSPDNVFDYARAGTFAVFSGHLHAGQLRVPLLGPAAVPSLYGRCFEHGQYRVGDTRLFVSAGLGTTFPAFRFCCHPDLFLVDLIADSALKNRNSSR